MGIKLGRGQRRALLGFIGALILVGWTSGTSSASHRGDARTHTRVYRFVLSNNFLGNGFRPQLEHLATLTADRPPFKGAISLQVVNAQNTTEAQIASLNNIVQTKPDVILVDAASPTALNPTINRACTAGIIVVSYDATVTSPCAWKVAENHYTGQYVIGEWMAEVLHDKGTVFVDRGLPGENISKTIHDGFLAGLKAAGPHIKVAAEYDGNYSLGPEQQGISSLLGGYPNVSGVMTQGYCTPVFNALKAAGKAAVPATCYGYNGDVIACGRSGHQCGILTGSPNVVQVAMKLALDALQHKPTPSKSGLVSIPVEILVSDKAKFHPKTTNGYIIDQIQIGKNCFPNLPPDLALPLTLPGYNITPDEAARVKT